MESLSCKVDKLYYSTIERAITDFYDMGYVDSSSLPSILSEDTDDSFYITATKKHGEFNIKITKQPDGTFWLFVSAYNLKKNK